MHMSRPIAFTRVSTNQTIINQQYFVLKTYYNTVDKKVHDDTKNTDQVEYPLTYSHDSAICTLSGNSSWSQYECCHTVTFYSWLRCNCAFHHLRDAFYRYGCLCTNLNCMFTDIDIIIVFCTPRQRVNTSYSYLYGSVCTNCILYEYRNWYNYCILYFKTPREYILYVIRIGRMRPGTHPTYTDVWQSVNSHHRILYSITQSTSH